MARSHSKSEATVWVAVDIAKRVNDVLLQMPDGHKKRFKVPNQRLDFEAFAKFLKGLPNPCKIGFEPTGNYHRPLAHFLVSRGFDLCMISSLAVARSREAVFNSWDKNDPKDAEVILSLMKQGLTQVYHDPLAYRFHDIQELAKTYQQTSLARTRLQHSLMTHYLPLYFPEAQRYFHASRAEWFMQTLVRFPTPGSITRYDFETFLDMAWNLVGPKINKRTWLFDFYQTAQSSIALPVDENSLGVETFRMILKQYLAINEQRKKIEAMAHDQLSGYEDYHRLRSLPGIGPIIALIIMAETGDLRRFHHHRQFLKFCGFDLATNQSGSFKGQSRLSKRGNARLRYAFWIAATVAIRQRENTFRRKYENYIKKDPDNRHLKRKAYTAVAAKMARVAYSLVKNQTDYRCYHDNRIPSGSIPL